MSAALSSILAVAAIAAAAAGTAISFDAAAKAKKKEAKALAEVKDKMSQARKKLETNYMDVLSINKEPFERQREALLSAGAQALEAGIESERGAGATVGRLLAAQNEAQGQVRDAQSDRLFDLEAAQAEEDSRLRDIGVQLDLGEVAGAQEAAAAASDRAAQMTNQGMQGVVNTVGAVASAAPLYAKGSAGRQANVISNNSSTAETVAGIKDIKTNPIAQEGTAAVAAVEGVGKVTDSNYKAAVVGKDASADYRPAENRFDGVDITEIQDPNLTDNQFKAFMSKQSGKWARNFRKSPEGLNINRKINFEFMNPMKIF